MKMKSKPVEPKNPGNSVTIAFPVIRLDDGDTVTIPAGTSRIRCDYDCGYGRVEIICYRDRSREEINKELTEYTKTFAVYKQELEDWEHEQEYEQYLKLKAKFEGDK